MIEVRLQKAIYFRRLHWIRMQAGLLALVGELSEAGMPYGPPCTS